MFQFILLAAILYVVYKWLRLGVRQARGNDPPPSPAPEPFDRSAEQVEEMLQDPVCGTWVPVSQAIALKRNGETIHFCSPECREKYLQETKK